MFFVKFKGMLNTVGILIPYLCVVFLILFLSAAKMTCLFFRLWGTRHSKAGFLSIPLVLAYSATLTENVPKTFSKAPCLIAQRMSHTTLSIV